MNSVNGGKNLISVLMPTYNVKAYVGEAVNSILSQTYSDFELIIVDDKSTDGTYEILQELSEKDSRIRLYQNDKNSKICKTLNRALSYAQGEYIARMDGDDIAVADRFEKMKEYLDENRDIAIVGSYLISIDEKGTEFGYKKYPRSSKLIQLGNKTSSCVPHFWMARKEIYDRLHGYRMIPYAEDYDFLLRGELLGYKYANIGEYLYKCRIRSGNTASANGLSQRKAAEYVKRLHDLEKVQRTNLFVESDYLAVIKFGESEGIRYKAAAANLNVAVHSKADKIKCMKHLFKAVAESKYVRDYLVGAMQFRILLLLDRIR